MVGAVCRWEERILLCRRAIEPRTGYWTLPAGYLELNEATPAGAAREAWEEARAQIEIEGLLAVYDIPRLSQVQLIYRALLVTVPRSPRSRKASRCGSLHGTRSHGTIWPFPRSSGRSTTIARDSPAATASRAATRLESPLYCLPQGRRL